jgi:hypothetical protein
MGALLTPLDEVLGSVAKVRVVRALYWLAPHGTSGRDVARLAEVSLLSAQRALADLVALGIVHRRVATGQHLYTLARGHALVREGLEPLLRAERALADAVGVRLRGLLAGEDGRPRPGVVAAAVFGAAAREEDAPGDEVDLLVLVDAPEEVGRVDALLADAAPALAEELGVRLAPVVIQLRTLERMHAAGDPFPAEVMADGRPVLGPSIAELLASPR